MTRTRALLITLVLALSAAATSAAVGFTAEPSGQLRHAGGGGKDRLDRRLPRQADGLRPRSEGRRATEQAKPRPSALPDGRREVRLPQVLGRERQARVMLGIQGKYSPSVTPAIRYSHLPVGKHTLVVFLANNDHSPEGAKASITFTVR